MCEIADSLRAEWYKTTIQIDGVPTEAQKAQIMHDRQKPEYREAIRNIVDHMALCPICALIWDRPKPVDETIAPWSRRLENANKHEQVDYTDI